MPSDETLKALIEAIVYVSPDPVSAEKIARTLEALEGAAGPAEAENPAANTRAKIQTLLDALVVEFERPEHGIHIRQVAGGYKFSSKPEHHEILRTFVKSLKPPIRLSKPALETLSVIAYRQPVTLPEIDEIRGVDCGGVIHTLLEKKLVVTSGRKNVVGRPILYRTSRDFLVHFGLKDVSELPNLREFEELARQALGGEEGVAAPDPHSSPANGPSEDRPGLTDQDPPLTPENLPKSPEDDQA
jgi:segregation and condensation protein B